MDRCLTRLPLPQGLLETLQTRGFRTSGDIIEVPPSKLSNGTLFCDIIKALQQNRSPHTQTELEISHQEALELWKSAKRLGE